MGITIYALIRYGNSVDDEDITPVSDRFSSALRDFIYGFKKGVNYTVVEDDDEEEENKDAGKEQGQTLFFPTDAEVEKRKRDIH